MIEKYASNLATNVTIIQPWAGQANYVANIRMESAPHTVMQVYVAKGRYGNKTVARMGFRDVELDEETRELAEAIVLTGAEMLERRMIELGVKALPGNAAPLGKYKTVVKDVPKFLSGLIAQEEAYWERVHESYRGEKNAGQN